ncbi:hypothetical protein HNO88_001556 [Novosphingobium chloroacetimidivorans]|uniref:Uncharacterized protein n=1 Tax=Novosphingobium chloroacetimidivorans TaxID=1428314 RepID=A0A7W7K8J8_9SPHN|nr:hypothetical protein [Novosphingobium chloroacetimidivorans]MBB4858237.1 hypothetical protein [Novosphingobium chloroacetimidivorans]
MTADLVTRAFELARSGKYRELIEIERQLTRENYSNVGMHLNGPLLRKQLRAAMVAAK